MAPKRSTRIRVDPRRAIAYLRVSTDRETQALGIAAQRTALESWAVRDGIEIAAWFIEEVSGGASLEKRPVLLEAIAALNDHKAGLLVVQRLDRFSRDPLSAAMAEIEVAKFGARVVTADGVGNGDDPGSRLMKDIGLAAARFERAMIAARTKAAMQVKKARGQSTGTAPYGWRVGEDGKSLVADENEQAVLVRLRGLRANGWSYRAIREEVTRLECLGRTGKPFTLQAVFEMTKDIMPEECVEGCKRERFGRGHVSRPNRSPFLGHRTLSGAESPKHLTNLDCQLFGAGSRPLRSY